MFRGLICQWINITRRKTVRRCIEQVWQITDCILFIIFSTWFYQLWFYQYFISSLSNLNFCHLFLPGFQPSINTSPQPALFDLPTTANNGSSELNRPGYMGFYIFVIAMNDYVSNYHQSKNFCIAIAKYQPLYFKIRLPFHIIDEDRNTTTTICFYMVLKHHNLTDKMRQTEIPPTYSVASLMLPILCWSFFPKCYNACPYICMAMSVAKKKHEYTV